MTDYINVLFYCRSSTKSNEREQDQDKDAASILKQSDLADHVTEIVQVSKIPTLLFGKKNKEQLEKCSSDVSLGCKPKKSSSNSKHVEQTLPKASKSDKKQACKKKPQKTISKASKPKSPIKLEKTSGRSTMNFDEIPSRANTIKLARGGFSFELPTPKEPSLASTLPFTDPDLIEIPQTKSRPKKLNLSSKFSSMSFTDAEPPFYDPAAVPKEPKKAAPSRVPPAKPSPIMLRPSKSESRTSIKAGAGKIGVGTGFNSHSRQNSQVSNATYTIEAYDSESTYRYD